MKSRQLDVNLYSIRSRVQNVYLGIVLIDRQLELNDVKLANLTRNLEEISAMVKNGVAYESDIDQIKVSILSVEQQKASLETDRKAYVQMLSLLTGTDMTGVSLTEPDARSLTASGIRSPKDYDESIARPELNLYNAQTKQLEMQRSQLTTNLSPKLNLNLQAGYGRPGLNMLSGEFDPYFVAGVKLQWNLSSFYTLKNDRRKIEADAAKITLARESFLLNTSVEAVQKRGEIEKAEDVIRRDGEIIALRQNIRETAEKQYKEGIIKMNDYLSLLDEEFNAKLNYNLHNVQYIMALYDLQNTLGTNEQ